MSNLESIQKRQNELILFLKINKVSVQEMSIFTGISVKILNGYIDGIYQITHFKWNIIQAGIDKYRNNIVPPPAPQPKGDSKKIIPEFVLTSLKLYDNAIIQKKRIMKREKQFIEALLEHGYDCRMYENGSDYWIIENKERFKKTI